MKDDRMGTKKILSLLIEFSIPAIVGMLVNAIYNIVDRMFIGNAPGLGTLGIAGITISYPVTLVLMALCLGSGVGGGTRFSISLGKGEREEAKKYMGNSFMLSCTYGILFMILGNIFMEPILVGLSASNEVLPYAKEYLSIILYGAVFQAIAMWGNNLSRAQGNPRNAMISQLIGAGFNIIFDYIFIFVFDMGMAGAAWATIGGQALSAIWQLAFIMSDRSIIKMTKDCLRVQVKYIKNVFLTGLPMFLMQMANSVLNIVLNGTVSAHGGDIAITAVGVITSFQTLLLMPLTGLAQGQQPLISYNYGAGNMDRVRQTLRYSIIGGTIFAFFGFLVVQLFPQFIISMFTPDKDVIEMGSTALRIWFMAVFIVGAQMVCANYFQALGRVKIASLLNLTRQVIVLIPLIIIFAEVFGLYGIFFAVPVADLTASIITFVMLKRDGNSIINILKIKKQDIEQEVIEA
ncbi:MAG: MATE family efflux transporter [Coprobacillaceae bacterium]